MKLLPVHCHIVMFGVWLWLADITLYSYIRDLAGFQGPCAMAPRVNSKDWHAFQETNPCTAFMTSVRPYCLGNL